MTLTQSEHRALAIEPALIQIPAGWFLMGSNSGQDCERPIHRVWTDAFLLAATQVTNAEYERFLRATSAAPPPFWQGPKFQSSPAARCRSLLARSHPILRVAEFANRPAPTDLPTEAEWERAARGGLEQKNFPWGDEPPQSLPNYATRWQTGPEQVARYAPNAFGLYDIGDNVHEWCSDWYDPNYYAASPDRNPRGPEQGKRKSSRGGSWRHHIKVARCAARSSIPPEFQYADYGFRVARRLSNFVIW